MQCIPLQQKLNNRSETQVSEKTPGFKVFNNLGLDGGLVTSLFAKLSVTTFVGVTCDGPGVASLLAISIPN